MVDLPHILIVDDHPLIASAAADLIRTSIPSATIVKCSSLSDALYKLTQFQPWHLVVLDLNLPDARGATVVRSLRETAPELPVLVFTAVESAVVRRHAIELGAARVVSKSQPPQALRDAVCELLGLALAGSACDGASSGEGLFLELTHRQRDILKQVASGASNAQIAQHFDLTENTVKSHVHAILQRIGSRNRTEAARWYFRHFEQPRH